jgi:CheY-like chemotaxis protein
MTKTATPLILLADDDLEDQEILKEAIAQQDPGASVVTTNNGQEALSYLKTCPDDLLPDLIVLDYKMPLLNGPEVLERLCKDIRYASIPMVVWSTSSQRQYIDACLDKGALQFFTKPDTPSALEKLAGQLLSLCR